MPEPRADLGRIHFVYAKPGPRPYFRSRIPRALELRARRILDHLLAPEYRFGGFPKGPVPLPAPCSITVNLYRYLREHRPTCFYDFRERRSIQLGENDILLGHPHPDPSTIVQQTLLTHQRCRCRALIFPLHHAIPSINEYALGLMDQADVLLGIMGPYWHDTLETSFLCRWKTKIVPLDMAVDGMQYPLVKRGFNPPGGRGYFYIGSNRPEKGCDILGQTMAELTDFTTGWIGSGPDIPHMRRIATHAELTPDFISKIAEEFDFFVNTSISDANPTTILEAMAWGFPVACTPQSGYYNMPSVVTLSTTDIQANVRALLELQYRPEEELGQIGLRNRQLIETRYTWVRFCETVWRSLQGFL